MKMIAGFVIGVIICLITMLTISSQTQAAEGTIATTDGLDLTSLLPDITSIYDNAVALPYQQVQAEITDPSIAAFFSKYVEATGLDKIGTP
jgi:hypothetical protein